MHPTFVLLLLAVLPWRVIAQEVASGEPPLTVTAAETVGRPLPTRVRFSFERVDVRNDERMGLFGLHYDVFRLRSRGASLRTEGWYLGFGGYGALTGQRGGFFVGGLGGGHSFALTSHTGIDFGGFLGGGGGRAAAQGDGLLLRGSVALVLRIEGLRIRLERSVIDVPDGPLGGGQIALGLSVDQSPSLAFPASGDGAAADGQPMAMRMRRVALTLFGHAPSPSARRSDGSVLRSAIVGPGIRLDAFIDQRLLLSFDVNGALSGGVDGFAQLLAGLGFEQKIARDLLVAAFLQVGSAGGGGVDTGGGLLVVPSVEFRARLGPRRSLFLGAGHTRAPGGKFRAWTWKGGVALEARSLRFDDVPGAPLPPFAATERWAVGLTEKIYLTSSGARTKSGQSMAGAIQLIGIGVSTPLLSWLELTGQAFGAFDGGVGGYAEGLLGLEVRRAVVPQLPRLHWVARGLVGAAGGGGMDVGDGAIWEVDAGVRLDTARQGLALAAEGGVVRAFGGAFDAAVLRLSAVFDFALPILDPSSPILDPSSSRADSRPRTPMSTPGRGRVAETPERTTRPNPERTHPRSW